MINLHDRDGTTVTSKLMYIILDYWTRQDDEVLAKISDLTTSEQKIVIRGIKARRFNARLRNWNTQYEPRDDNNTEDITNDSNTSKPRDSIA